MIRFEHFAIRPYTMDDLDDLSTILGDPQLMKYLEKTYSCQETEEFLIQYGLRECPAVYALEECESSRLAGHIIFHPYDVNSYEIGWIILKEFQGGKLASKVTRELVRYGMDRGIHEYVIECVPDQKACIHIAEKCGFEKERKDGDLLVFRKTV
jgi:RimJ/RimL family protein N-acetyltransferase